MAHKLPIQTYLFDTSAILTYLQNEDGADVIENLLVQYFLSEINIVISVISLVELRYKFTRQYAPSVADDIIQRFLLLNIDVIDFDKSLVVSSATYKAMGKMSFADACIAGTAKQLNAILVHKDPEYTTIIQDIGQLPLPFKPKNNS